MLNIDHYLHGFRFTSIDPGLNNIGIANFELDVIPQVKIRSIETLTLQENRVIDEICYDSEREEERFYKRARMVAAVMLNIKATDPTIVVVESPFYDRNRPGSYAVLVEVVSDIRTAIHRYNNNIFFQVYAPQEVKKTLGVAGIKGKEVVKEAMRTFEPIRDVLKTDFETMTEHAIDATAVGYTFYDRVLKKGITSCSLSSR